MTEKRPKRCRACGPPHAGKNFCDPHEAEYAEIRRLLTRLLPQRRVDAVRESKGWPRREPRVYSAGGRA